MTISGHFIGGYFRLNYHKLLMVISGVILLMDVGCYSIGGYSINVYCWLFYCRSLVVILLVSIDGYFTSGYFWLF